jgi:hypothetical protein
MDNFVSFDIIVVHSAHYIDIQGLINLADNKVEDGGFQLIPGFHKHIVEFVTATQVCRLSILCLFVICWISTTNGFNYFVIALPQLTLFSIWWEDMERDHLLSCFHKMNLFMIELLESLQEQEVLYCGINVWHTEVLLTKVISQGIYLVL